MRQRMSRSHKSRRGFKIDTILDKLLAKKKQEQNLDVRGYMTLTFLGFYDKRGTFQLSSRFYLSNKFRRGISQNDYMLLKIVMYNCS